MSSVNDAEPAESIQRYEVSHRANIHKVLNKRKSHLRNHHEVSNNRSIRKDIVIINRNKILYNEVRKKTLLDKVLKRLINNHEVSNKSIRTNKKRKDEIAKHYEVSNKRKLIFKKTNTKYHKVGCKTNADKNIRTRDHEVSTNTHVDRVLQKCKDVQENSYRSIKRVVDKRKVKFKNNQEVSDTKHKGVVPEKNRECHEVSNRSSSTELIKNRKCHEVSNSRSTELIKKRKQFQQSIEEEKERKNKPGITKWRRESRWRICTVLMPLIISNIIGLTGAESLTSRVLASFLGYPTTCNIGAEVRPCTLSLSCWIRGGTRVRGCGSSWLFSCCLPPEFERNDFDNMIPSSDWRYKVVPPKLRQIPQRNVVPTNVFRRRVDEDMSQIECGLPSTRILQKRIIGGREARFAEFPWQAHVRISEFQCGGVLISKWFVATAAHCVSRARPRDIAIWLGALDTTAGTNTARRLGVVQKILHPLFQFRMTQPDRYDIALLRLSRPITYTTHILPICLPDTDIELRGKSGVIAGWGKTDASNGHTGTNLLRSATVPILSTEQCINWHQSKQILVEIHSEMICAGHSDGHQDACLGDSGGPLIVFDSGRYYLVGITSAGFGCGVDHQPGIYHNVKTTTNWIKDVINPVTNYIDF